MTGYWGTAWKRFTYNKFAVAGLFIVLFLFLIALCAPLIANNKPYIIIKDNALYSQLSLIINNLRGLTLKR